MAFPYPQKPQINDKGMLLQDNGVDYYNPQIQRSNGRFMKGNDAAKGLGNTYKAAAARIRHALIEALTKDKVEKIINKTIADAINGDAVSRKFLFDYIAGPPKEIILDGDDETKQTGLNLIINVTDPNGKPPTIKIMNPEEHGI